MVEEQDVLEAAERLVDESDLNTVTFKTIRRQLKKQLKCSMKPFKKVLKKAVDEMVVKRLAREDTTIQTEESFHLHYTPSMAVDNMEVPADEQEHNEEESETSPQIKKSKKHKSPKQRKHKKRQHVRDEEIAVVSDQDGSDGAGAVEPEEPIPRLLNDDDIDMDDDQTTGTITEDKILPAFLRAHEEEEYIPNAPEAGRRKPKKASTPKKRDPTPKQQQEKIAEIYKESSKIYRDSELVIPMQTTEHTPTYSELLERSKKRREEYLARKARARPSSAESSSKSTSPQKPTQFAPRLTDPSQDSSEGESDEEEEDSSDDSSNESGEDSMEMDSVSSNSIPVMPSLPMGTIATPAMTLDLVS